MSHEKTPVWKPILDSLLNCDFNKVIPDDKRDEFNQFVRDATDSQGGFLVSYMIQAPDGRSVSHAFYYSSDDRVISAREAIIDLKGVPQRWGRNFTLDPHRTLEQILALPVWDIPATLTVEG